MNIARRTLAVFAITLVAAILFDCKEARAATVLQVGKNFTSSTYMQNTDALTADSDGAIGPNHFVEFINGRFAVYDKQSGALVQSRTDFDFWTNSGVVFADGLYTKAPRIVFDTGSQRWFVAEVDVDPVTVLSNRFLIAVSAGTDPTGAWSGFGFKADATGGNFVDFATLGIDANGVYLGGDVQNTNQSHIGCALVSINKNGMLANPASVTNRTSFGILATNKYGVILQPVVTRGAASSGETVLSIADLGLDLKPHSNVVAVVVQNAGGPGSATLSNTNRFKVPSYSVPLDAPQPNGEVNLNDGDTRFGATVYRIGDILYAVHSTEVSNRAAIQWFKINATNFTVIQSGMITNSSLHLFFPSIAANEAGNVVIACNGCSTNSFVSCYATLAEFTNGTLTFGSLVLVKAGTAGYRSLGSGGNGWGRYSSISVDPSDPNRFWTVQMFPVSRRVWSTQVTELIAGPLAVSVTPTNGNLLVSWPDSAVGFSLQSSTNIASTNWSAASGTVTTNSNQISVLLPLSGNQGFYRLTKP